MPNLNKVMLIGNLTRDPQFKQLQNNTSLVEFGLAVNRRWRTPDGQEKEEVTFVDCSAFGKQADTINQYCQKGKGLFIEGRLKFDQWEDKSGGGKRSKLSVVVENFQFIGGRGDGEGGQRGDATDDEYERRQPQRQASGRGNAPAPDDEPFKEDDIPF